MGWHLIGHVLSYPDGSGIVGEVLLSVPAYIHTHLKLSRHHRERMQAGGGPGADHH